MQFPGKSWNLLGSGADSGHSDADADAKISCGNFYMEYRVNNCKKCSNSFFAISSQHVTVMNIYSSMDAAIILYMWLVTAVYLYILTLLAYDSVLEMLLGSWKSPGIFCSPVSGNHANPSILTLC